MEKMIGKLNKIAERSNERAKKNIQNLISRINFFQVSGDEEKLLTCIAEAELWGAI